MRYKRWRRFETIVDNGFSLNSYLTYANHAYFPSKVIFLTLLKWENVSGHLMEVTKNYHQSGKGKVYEMKPTQICNNTKTIYSLIDK